MKQCIQEVLQEYWQTLKYEYEDDYDQAWNKFLTFVIEHIPKGEDEVRQLTEVVIATHTSGHGN